MAKLKRRFIMVPQQNTTANGPLKIIFKGRLEFGNQRTFEMASKHWLTRLENYFKSDILFKHEEIFLPDEFAMALPQPHSTFMSSEKAWRGTTDMMKEIVQFAVVGKVQAWYVLNGQHVEMTIEPKTDKAAVLEYWLGCELLGNKDNNGMEDAAAALSRAIDKYQRHALAYERRGYINYKLGNFNDALYDFNKSIDIYAGNPEPHYGRGKVRMLKNEWAAAAQDFDCTIKRSIALQPIFWLARLKKGECLVHNKQFAEAIVELQMFLKRDFVVSNPNYTRRRRAWFLLAKALFGAGSIDPALDALNQALATKEGVDLQPEAEVLLQRGIVRRQVGKAGFAEDFASAAKMGNAEAVKILAEL